jgi:hypothetical protein
MGYIYLIFIERFNIAYENNLFDFSRLYNTRILDSLDATKSKVLRDDIGIYKFGKTKNLDKRFLEHCKSYKCPSIKIVHFKEVGDERLTVEESKVKNFFLDRNTFFIEKSYDKKVSYKELVLIRDEDLQSYILKLN